MATPTPACGIDYGTSNSAVALAVGGQVVVVPPDPGSPAPSLPSVAYLHREGRREAGEDAVREYFTHGHLRTLCQNCSLVRYGIETECRQFRRGGGCNDTRLVTGVKRDLSRLDFIATHSWARDFDLPDLVSIVLERLRNAAGRAAGAEVRRVVLGHPVVFPGTGEIIERSHEQALARLEEGARQAGFEEIAFFPEPAAAVIGEDLPDGRFLSVDFGGGTFDAAVIQARSGAAEVQSLAGVAIGGTLFDQALFETAVGERLGLDALPYWLFNDMRSLAGVHTLLSDAGLPGVIGRVGGEAARVASAILFEGNAYSFYKSIEDAKIRLSTAPETELRFRRPGIDLSVTLRRSEFEAVIKPDLERVETVYMEALDRAGIGPDGVDYVLRTGGSSRLPAFMDRLEAIFGAEKVRERDAFTGVVRGLGARARDIW